MTETPPIDVPSTESPVFRAQACAALDRAGELVVAYYLAYGGGWIEWHIVRTRETLLALLKSGKRRSAFDVYLTPQLQLRGVAGPELEAQVVSVLRATKEVLLAVPSTQRKSLLAQSGTVLDHCGADEERDVHEWFVKHADLEILAGQHPALLPDDPTIVLKARVPDADGKVRSASW